MAGSTATLTSKFQITIPARVRERLGLKQGEVIVLDVEGDHAVLRPVRAGRAAGAWGLGADLWAAVGGSAAVEAERDAWEKP
jgi:AbrB family looped-hinge helix DNA binding protein